VLTRKVMTVRSVAANASFLLSELEVTHGTVETVKPVCVHVANADANFPRRDPGRSSAVLAVASALT
jgi:hypothetical protein